MKVKRSPELEKCSCPSQLPIFLLPTLPFYSYPPMLSLCPPQQPQHSTANNTTTMERATDKIVTA